MIDWHNFPLDHFGVVTSPLIRQMLDQSSNKRKRQSALRALVKIAEVSKQIPKGSTVQFVGINTDCAGQMFLTYAVGRTEEHEPSQQV